jgi:lipopolysaccharide export system protein LptC
VALLQHHHHQVHGNQLFTTPPTTTFTEAPTTAPVHVHADGGMMLVDTYSTHRNATMLVTTGHPRQQQRYITATPMDDGYLCNAATISKEDGYAPTAPHPSMWTPGM